VPIVCQPKISALLWASFREQHACKQKRRATVPKIVQTQCCRKLCSFQDWLEVLLNNVQSDKWLTFNRGKNEIKVLVVWTSLEAFSHQRLATTFLQQIIQTPLRHLNRPLALAGKP